VRNVSEKGRQSPQNRQFPSISIHRLHGNPLSEQKNRFPEENSSEQLLLRVTDSNQLNIFSLVLSAAGIEHRIHNDANHHQEILVARDQLDNALREISAYMSENENWPPQPQERDAFTPIFRAMSPLIVGCLVILFGITGDWKAESAWFANGAGDSTAILNNHELFRLVTALTLHADFVHLLSNAVLGVFLLHYFLQLTGNGIGLAAMLVTSVTANYLNVLMHGPGHMFVGFSTAVFSIIGMLCTISFALKTTRFVLHLFMAVMAGLALLALLGSEGERTDLGSHLFGLFCGLIGGNIIRLPCFPMLRASFWLQTLLGAVVLLAFYACWIMAFI